VENNISKLWKGLKEKSLLFMSAEVIMICSDISLYSVENRLQLF